LVCVGTELLFGQTINTNAAYISSELQALGVSVLWHHTVGDNPSRVRQTLDLALSGSDIVITTGGLGPTQDDLTKELIAEVMGEELVFDKKAMDMMIAHFKSFGNRVPTKNNEKQAYLPASATPFYNEVGTAPGFALNKNGKTIMAIPGPPREMRYMMEKYVVPYLSALADSALYQQTFRTFGIGESRLETELLPIIEGQTDPTVATYAKDGECAVRVASMRPTAAEAEAAVKRVIASAAEIVGEFIYSYEDKELHHVVVDLLKEKNLIIATAESCTGGEYAQSITSVPGASLVFGRGFITYSNDAKKALLGVGEDVLSEYGAVSEQCAAEMAEGARLAAGSDIGVSITGIAGPDGGSVEKPVGTVWLGLSFGGKVTTVLRVFPNRGRQYIRRMCVLEMHDIVRRAVLGKGPLDKRI
jgi:nicotinamide-nucleotide amidase